MASGDRGQQRCVVVPDYRPDRGAMLRALALVLDVELDWEEGSGLEADGLGLLEVVRDAGGDGAPASKAQHLEASA